MSDSPTRSLPPGDDPVATPSRDAAAPRSADNTVGPSEAHTDAGPPLAPPGYELLEEIGRGGMGVVYRAREVALNRGVAIKLLRDRYTANSPAAIRFVEEALITGQLQHPGIPPVHQVGALPDGRPFLAMKLIKGRTLEDFLDERKSPVEDCGRFLAAFEQVCQAVACAHDRKVIHRDLKPSNVMVGSFGEVQVMDWGLAKLVTTPPARTEAELPEPVPAATEIRTLRDSEGSFTQAGSIMGTPAFMPPEQAGGEIERIDERSDVFGLGAILCVILTGQPPYTGKDSDSVRLKAIRGQLDECLARLDVCGAEPELVALCKRCLARDPEARPRHAGDVAAAVASLRAAADERARQAELDRVKAEGDKAAAELRAAEQRKRRRVQAALGLTFTALVVLGGAFAWWQDRQAVERKAEKVRVEGERSADRAAVESRARQAVASATTQAAELRDKYRFADAAATLDQAEALIPPEAPALRAAIAAARKELAFVRQLDQIRTSRIQSDFFAGQAAIRRSYPAAFRDLGVDPTGPDSAVVGDRVAASPIKRHLVIALDDWSWNESNPVVRRQLLAVARRADPGAWSDRLRDTAVQGDPVGLDRLAAEVDPAAVPANLVVLLFQIRPRGWEAGPKWLATAVHRHPGDFWMQFEAGYYYYAKDIRPAVAVGYLRAAYSLRPDLPLVGKMLIECVIRAGHVDEAVVELREIIRHDPNAAWPHAVLAMALRRTDPDGAIAEHNEAIRLEPNNPWFRGDLGWTLQVRDPDGAIAAYNEAIRLLPTYAVFHAYLAQVFVRKKDYDAAIAEYRAAIRLDSRNSAWHDQLAFLLLQKRDGPGALVAATEAVRLDPKFAQAYVNLGRARQATGDLNGAVAAYKEAIRIGAKSAVVYNNLAWVLATGPDGVRDGKRAVEHATRACELTAWQDPISTDTLAAAHAEAGDFDKSVEYQKKAMTFPAFPKAELGRARERLDLYARKKPYRDAALAPRALAPPPRAGKRP